MANITSEHSQIVFAKEEELRPALKNFWYSYEVFQEINKSLNELVVEDLEVFAMRVEKKMFSTIQSQLEEDPSKNQMFEKETPYPILNQILTVARLKELAKAKIIRRGKRSKTSKNYDIGELAATFYGKTILESLNMQRRRVIDNTEFAQLEAACAKIKLKLPQHYRTHNHRNIFQLRTKHE